MTARIITGIVALIAGVFIGYKFPAWKTKFCQDIENIFEEALRNVE